MLEVEWYVFIIKMWFVVYRVGVGLVIIGLGVSILVLVNKDCKF